MEEIAKTITEQYSSVESALELRILFDVHYKLATNDPIDNLLGPILFRDEEETHVPLILKESMDIYHLNKINKYFGISFDKFMELTRVEIEYMRDTAIRYSEMDKAYEDELKEALEEEGYKI